MKHRKLVILGSTGSIGCQALDIIREHSDNFEVVALSCQRNWKKLAAQINEFAPSVAAVTDESVLPDLKNAIKHTKTEILTGSDSLTKLAKLPDADVVLNALVGFAGFEPTWEALRAGNKVALANKESLVVGGELLEPLFRDKDLLVPVDSEHSAMLQCLVGESRDRIEKIIITASGGPFRTWSRMQMKDITVEDALDHPNWSMGAKITIDSATMMNKGLEIIEACRLFNLPLKKVEAVVHPQSIIHSVVTFTDGSSKAQLGPPDMKVPILYALTYPNRLPHELSPRLDWQTAFDLNFEPVDIRRFPCIRLAMEAMERGSGAPAVLNAANEVAVERFLNREISYIKIPFIIESCLEEIDDYGDLSVEALKEIDRNTRKKAQKI